MPILQKRKVQFAEDLKTYGMKKVKLGEKLTNAPSSDSESEDESFKNKISSKEEIVLKVTEELKTYGMKKVKLGKIQKHASSSESELEDETPKNKISPKKRKILKVAKEPKTNGMKKVKPGQIQKYTSSSESESENETSKNKTSPKKQAILKNGSPAKPFDSSTSLTKDTTLSADEGSKNSKENGSKNSESSHSDSDEPPLVIDEDEDNDLLGLQKYMKDELLLNISSPVKEKLNRDAPQSIPDLKNELSCKENAKRNLDKGIKSKKDMIKNSGYVGSNSESESESDIEGTQETVNANNCRQTKRNMNKKLNNASSESESDSKKMQKRDSKKDAKFIEGVNKNSNHVDSESESDIEGTQEIVNKKNYQKGMKIKTAADKKLNVISSDSEYKSKETQGTVNTKQSEKVADLTKKDANENMKSVISESESESDVDETQKQISKVVTSDSESDEEKTQESESKSNCIKGVEININVDEQSNLNTSETQFDEEETQKVLKNKFNSPKIDYDMQMLSKTKKAHNSDNSDFELTLESGASHEEKGPASSDTDSRKKKKKLSLPRKAPSPVAETIRESDDLAPENELTLENGGSHEDKELASTDTDSKKPIVFNGTLKRTKKQTRTSPRKAPLPVAEVKSENELASGTDSLHEVEEQASSDIDIDARKSKTDAKVKKPSASKKKRLSSPEKAPPAVAEARRELTVLEPKIEEDEVSSDDSADEEDLNESLLNCTQSTYRPTEEEKRRLASIEIQIKHKVLPQHNVESTAGTRTLKQREKIEFEKYAMLKRGTFDSTEDKQIKKNWKTFCKNHQWNPKNPKPFLFMKHKNKEALMSQVNRKKFMQILAHGLPNRSLYSVFQRFKNLYDPHRTCRYTDDEDRVIVDFISTYNAVDAKDRKFAELAAILKRTRASVWRRYRVLKKKQLLSVDDALCHSSR